MVKITSEIPQTEVGHLFQKGSLYISFCFLPFILSVITLKYLLISRKSVLTDLGGDTPATLGNIFGLAKLPLKP